jgi:hypothetical protein
MVLAGLAHGALYHLVHTAALLGAPITKRPNAVSTSVARFNIFASISKVYTTIKKLKKASTVLDAPASTPAPACHRHNARWWCFPPLCLPSSLSPGRCPHLHREHHPQAHRAHDLPPPRLDTQAKMVPWPRQFIIPAAAIEAHTRCRPTTFLHFFDSYPALSQIQTDLDLLINWIVHTAFGRNRCVTKFSFVLIRTLEIWWTTWPQLSSPRQHLSFARWTPTVQLGFV